MKIIENYQLLSKLAKLGAEIIEKELWVHIESLGVYHCTICGSHSSDLSTIIHLPTCSVGDIMTDINEQPVHELQETLYKHKILKEKVRESSLDICTEISDHYGKLQDILSDAYALSELTRKEIA